MSRTLVLVVLAALLFSAIPVNADTKSDDVIKQFVAAAKALKTFQSDFEMSGDAMAANGMASTGHILAIRPNKVRQDLWKSSATGVVAKNILTKPHDMVIADGSHLVTVSADGSYTNVAQSADALEQSMIFDMEGLVSKNPFTDTKTMGPTKYVGVKDWLGSPYDVVEMTMGSGTGPSAAMDLYFGPDHLMHRIVIVSGGTNQGEMAYRNMVLNAPLKPDAFSAKLPRFAKKTVSAPATATAKIDSKSRIVLAAVAAKMAQAGSLSATFVNSNRRFDAKRKKWSNPVINQGEVDLSKPNLAYVHFWYLGHKKDSTETTRDLETFEYADGKTQWSYWDQKNKYYSKSAMSDGATPAIGQVRDLEPFFQKTPNLSDLAGWNTAREIHYLGTMTWRGIDYCVVSASGHDEYGGQSIDSSTRVFIGSDNLPHRVSKTIKFSQGSTMEMDFQLNDVRTPATLPASLFAFTPPAGATEKEQYPARQEKPLLTPGTTAPDFTVNDRSGKPIKLSDYAGRVVVIDFWATWCGPCQMSMPITNKVAKEYAGKNVTVLGINVWDTKDAFDGWLPKHKEYDSITFAIDPSDKDNNIASTLYGVSGIPTQYVIDPGGKIAWSNVGYDEKPTNLEKAIDDALKPSAPPAPSVAPFVAQPSAPK